jgi:hypothetical protein
VLNRLVALVVPATLLVGALGLSAAPAYAYQACQSESSASAGSSTVNGNQTDTGQATFKDCQGNAVAGAQVSFVTSKGPGSCQATFTPPSGVTDQNGQVSFTFTLPANCPGQYVLGAGVQGVFVFFSVREAGGFPNTGADPGAGGPGSGFGWLLVVAGLALLGGGLASFQLARR